MKKRIIGMLLASTTLAYCGAGSIPPGMSAGN